MLNQTYFTYLILLYKYVFKFKNNIPKKLKPFKSKYYYYYYYYVKQYFQS